MLFLKLITLITCLFIVKFSFAFINFKFGTKPKINQIEVNKEIENKLNKYNIINEINGFYGLIGPYCENETNNLMELFNSNGIIQGIFFENGKLHFVKQFVRTDKLEYELKNGAIPMTFQNIGFFKFMEMFGLLPNIFGLANTALMKFNKKIHALNENDMPYEIKVDFENHQIKTIKKIKLPFQIKNISAHSKNKYNCIETLNYDMISPKIKYFKLSDDLKIIKNSNIFNKKYSAMVHDFVSLNDYLIFLDSPILLNSNDMLSNILKNKKMSDISIKLQKKYK